MDFDENLPRPASACYNVYRTYSLCKQARWLFDMNNNHYIFLARSDNDRDSCISLKEPVKQPYDLSCTDDVRRLHLFLALHVR